MTRRTRLVAVLLLLAGAGAAAWLLRPAPERPNIVVLLWDTTRADRLSAYGAARKTTPWLEGLAARGVLFEQCRAPSPWTQPSHASLFTGLLPRHHGSTTLESPLAPAHRTLAERLKEAGYDTVLLSNNSLVSPLTGLAQGFDRFVDVGRATGETTAAATLEVLRAELAARRNDGTRVGRPLFLFVNLMDAHLPYEPPEEVARPWIPADAPEADVARLREFEFPRELGHILGISILPPADIAILRSLYDAEIRYLDDHGARMQRLLEEEGVLGGRSMLVVTSDHGEHLGEHGFLDHKLSVADVLLRVPLVLHAPGRFEGGRRVKVAVRLQDLFPTLLETAGLPVEGSATPHAASLLPAALDARPQVAEFSPALGFLPRMREIHPDAPESAFLPFHRRFVTLVDVPAAGRRLKWNITRRVEPGSSIEVEEGETLFDVDADPGEDRDLLGVPDGKEDDRAAAARLREMAERALGE